MSLKNAVTFVAGGCGIVGSGIVSSLLKEGAKCHVASRNDKSFAELKSTIPNQFHPYLHFHKADLTREDQVLHTRDQILQQEGHINHVVVSVGGWRTDGPLSTVALDVYQKTVAEFTLPHFNCYKSFVKILSQQPKSTYTMITGGSGEAKAFDPRASMLPISAGHVYGMFTSAVSEQKGNKNLSLIELRLFFWIRRQLDSKFDPKKSQMEVGHDYVGKFLPKIISRNKSEVYKIQTRAVGDQLYEKL